MNEELDILITKLHEINHNMKDTQAQIEELLHNLYMKKTPQERLQMGCSMFDTSKQLAISSIKEKNPGIGAKDLKKELFSRFYSQDFSKPMINKITHHLTTL